MQKKRESMLFNLNSWELSYILGSMTPLINVPFDWYLHVAELACQTLSFRLNKAYQLQSIKPKFTTGNQHGSDKVSPCLPGEPSLKCYTHVLFRLQWSNENLFISAGETFSPVCLHGLKLLCWQEAKYQSEVISSYFHACQHHSKTLTLCHITFVYYLHHSLCQFQNLERCYDQAAGEYKAARASKPIHIFQ